MNYLGFGDIFIPSLLYCFLFSYQYLQSYEQYSLFYSLIIRKQRNVFNEQDPSDTITLYSYIH